MKRDTPLGSRIAEVHNGSSLFTGDAGQGESNIRRWIIENDWLEAIVALPLNMFYNTGIATYIWVLTNRKPEHRRGKVQLIDATQWFKPLRKNLGKKNCELSRRGHPAHLRHLPGLRGDRAVEDLPQRRVRLLEGDGRAAAAAARRPDGRGPRTPSAPPAPKPTRSRWPTWSTAWPPALGPGPHADYNAFLAQVEADAERHGVKLTAKRLKLLQTGSGPARRGGRAGDQEGAQAGQGRGRPAARALRGDGRRQAVRRRVRAGRDLRDTEQMPLLEPGGIEAFVAPRGAAARAGCLVRPGAASRSATRSASRATSTSRSRCDAGGDPRRYPGAGAGDRRAVGARSGRREVMRRGPGHL